MNELNRAMEFYGFTILECIDDWQPQYENENLRIYFNCEKVLVCIKKDFDKLRNSIHFKLDFTPTDFAGCLALAHSILKAYSEKQYKLGFSDEDTAFDLYPSYRKLRKNYKCLLGEARWGDQ